MHSNFELFNDFHMYIDGENIRSVQFHTKTLKNAREYVHVILGVPFYHIFSSVGC